MKTQLSRNLFRPAQRYSAVFQQMGRVLTDADWNDAAESTRERQNDALIDVIGSGTPRERGLVAVHDNGDGTFTHSLQWGYAYVDGILAQVRPRDPSVTAFDYLEQADFPDAPELPAGDYRLYLDVWERAVTALEDPELRDPGLHGADTCTRTQTMAQVKWCPTSVDPADPAQNQTLGQALVSLELRQGSTSPDPCDPCAEELTLHDEVGNYLFRVEVHDVVHDTAGAPTRVTLKWSSENAGEQYVADDVPPGFATDAWLYEFFGGAAAGFAAEKHLGRHLAGAFAPQRGQLVTGFPEIVPAGTSLVRRWDGFCELQKSGSVWQLLSGSDRGVELSTALAAPDHGHVGEGATVVVNANAMTLSAQLADLPMLAGDYWCREVRQAVHSSGDLLMDAEAPRGIVHHYLDLGTVVGGIFNASGDNCRPFGFPTLTDLRAEDICYQVPECGTPAAPTVRSLLEDALADAFPNPGSANVRDILNALLCAHSATTLPIVKNEELCVALQPPEVRTVQDALNVLCEREIDGCATFTVFPRPGWEEVFDRIPAGGDASICFREGRYTLSEVVSVANKGHISLSGVGAGTQIVSGHRETALLFTGCRSVTVSDLSASGLATGNADVTEHLHGALTFVDCADVAVSRSVLACAAGTRPGATCLTITHNGARTGSARVSECHFDVGHSQIGMLLLNMERCTVNDNVVKTRPKPASMTLDVQLRDRLVAAAVRKLLLNNAVVRDFESAGSGKQNIQMQNNSQRQIMIESPVAASAWKNALTDRLGNAPLASNQALLNEARSVALRMVTEPAYRSRFNAFSRWFEPLREQNPAVAFKGIVCGGRAAKDIRIRDNTLTGVQAGIHIGVSNRNVPKGGVQPAGRVTIEGNTIGVLLSPIARHRRGGIYVGSCNHASVLENHITVQRFPMSSSTAVEGIRVYGRLGRMLMVRQNYMSNCTVGIRVVPVEASAKQQNQWLVAENMMPDANPRVSAPSSVQQVNNRS